MSREQGPRLGGDATAANAFVCRHRGITYSANTTEAKA